MSYTKVQKVEYKEIDGSLIPVYATDVVEQPWNNYTQEEHDIWKELFLRQKDIVNKYASDDYLKFQKELELSPNFIPKFSDLTEIIKNKTRWSIVGVNGLLPGEIFFELLSKKQFPVTWWIRDRGQMDYIAEPDLFHDLFGHVPLLMNNYFADYIQEYGKKALEAKDINEEAFLNLSRLYWYTVEFGLIRNKNNLLKIYGAGILSSKGEAEYSITSDKPHRFNFDIERVMLTDYKIDNYQKTYFIIDDFEQLFNIIQKDLSSIYKKLLDKPIIQP